MAGQTSDINSVTFSGRLVEDPMVRDNGPTTFRVRSYFRWVREGEERELYDQQWVTAHYALGDYAAQHLRSGDYVVVYGRITTRSWEQDGQRKYMTQIRAQSIVQPGLSSASEEDKTADQAAVRDLSVATSKANDSDIPF